MALQSVATFDHSGSIDGIGKEANKWEEQLHLGANPEAQIHYGSAPRDLEAYRQTIAGRLAAFPVRIVASRAGLSIGTVSNIRRAW